MTEAPALLLSVRLRRAVLFAVVFGLAAFLTSIPGALWRRHQIDPDLWEALFLFGAGAVVGGFISALILGRWFRQRTRSQRLAAAILVLALSTTLADVLFYDLQYLVYFAPSWAPAFTHSWLTSVVFTVLATGFFYVVIALPMLLLVGLPVLLVAAHRLSRR